jgi:hypothetical protein
MKEGGKVIEGEERKEGRKKGRKKEPETRADR